MKSSNLKFYSVLILHILMFWGFMLIMRLVPNYDFSRKEVVFFAIFSIVYFLLVWFDLYSRPYHHYLKNAFFFIFRDLIICSVSLFALESLFALVTHTSTFRAALINDLSFIVFYFLMHSIQYIWIIHLANLGFFCKNVMLIGTYDERIPVERLFQNINNTKNFVGQVLFRDGSWYYRTDLSAEPVIITKSLTNFLFSKNVNELIICIDDTISPEALHECAGWCIENSIGYYLIPDIRKLPHAFPWKNRFAIIPEIERYCPNRDSLIMVSLKRVIDIVISTVALVAFSPVFAILAILIHAEDGGPVFYISRRVGIHGKTIPFYKFRSMVLNADALKKDLLALNERPDGPLFKLTNDPRVTRIGRFMRRTSLDEIPQFLNVLKGDMSIVGPRPHLPEEVAAYSDRDLLRLECIPGIFCLPQIHGRNSLGFREWVDLDLEYRKNWTLAFDLRIMYRTVRVVLQPFFK